MTELLEWDTRLLIYLNNLGSEFFDPLWLGISEVRTWVPLYAFLIFLLYRALPMKAFLLTLPILILNVVMTDQGSVWLFKEQFQRFRPCHVEEVLNNIRLVKEGCGGYYGFVSSHASNTFGLAVLVGGVLKFKWSYLRAILLIWASVVAYSRIYLGVHYPLDIICGAAFGSICGFITLWIFKRLIKTPRP